ncbi:MAG: hypothetical protein IJH50_00340 [Kiritimatiellae bacterium]|nr:hypothetical protein [Kiritimatiellia bacterium]
MKDGTFRAGFARVDITPPLGTPIVGYFEERRAKGVLDCLEANALAVSDGERTAVLLSADLLGIEGVAFNAALRRRISVAAGVPTEAVYVHSTHTHTGPGAGKADAGRTDLFDGTDFYNEFLASRLADVAAFAVADLSPAQLAVGCAEAKRISFLRRYRMKDGSIRTNPGICNPDIAEPIGCLDETVRVLRVKRGDKGDIAVVNFATHPDVVGGDMISGDWPAFARRTFERAEPGTKCIFFNGAQGDVNHVCIDPRPGEREGLHPDFDDVDRGYEHAQHMGRVVAAAALSVWGKCVKVAAGPVRFAVRTVSVPSQMPKPEELPKAREYDSLHRAGRDAEIPFTGMALTTVVAEAGRMVLLADGPASFDLPLSAVSIGDSVVFAGIPGEPFSDIGRAIRERSPFAMTVCTCLTNGSCGYFPVESAYAEGGYEARSSVFASSVAADIVAGHDALLRQL